MTTEKRVIAHFQPQAWINDNAVEIDGAHRFDVTEQIVAMGREKALQIEDCQDTSDELWHAYVVGDPTQEHNGPFAVTVAEAIKEFFAG